MHFSWLGTSAIKLQTKPYDKDVTIVIDPYKPTKGSFPRSLTPNIAIYTRSTNNTITLSGNPFILSGPGECETDGVLITTVPGNQDNLLARVDAEGLSIGHLSLENRPLTDKQLSIISDVDILLIPVGHNESYTAEQAVKAVNSIEPKIVIPIAFKSTNDPEAKPVEGFLKEMGAKNGNPENKVIIKKKDLPQTETRVIVLEKE